VLPFVVVFKGRIALEVRAGQIIEEHVELRVEQIFPSLCQMVEKGSLVFEQPVQALVKFVDFHQLKACPQKIGHGACFIPVPVKPPLTPGINETVTAKGLGYQIPACSFAAQGQLLRPEFIETQLLVQPARQPACAPLPGPVQLHVLESNLHNLLIVDLAGILGKEGHRLRTGRAVFEDFNCPAPRLCLRIINFPEVEHVPLDHASAGYPAVFDYAPVPVFFPILLPIRATQEHRR